MRNPLILFLLLFVLTIAIAVVSVNFGVLSGGELMGKLKELSILLIPVILFVGVFAYDEWRKPKNREKEG